MSAKMRAKVDLLSVERHKDGERLRFAAVAAKAYRPDGLDEDNTYAKFSPSADFRIEVANPALLGQLNPGETYYVDFTPVPPAIPMQQHIIPGAPVSVPEVSEVEEGQAKYDAYKGIGVSD